MGFLGHLQWSLRHCRKRLFESILIVLAIGLGIAVIVSILTMIINVRAQIDVSGSSEWMRTFRIYSAANFSSYSSNEPVLQIVQPKPSEPLQLPLSELQNLQDSLPDGMHVFWEQNYAFPTKLLPKTVDETEAPIGQYEQLVPSSTGIAVSRGVSMEVEVSKTETESFDAEDIQEVGEQSMMIGKDFGGLSLYDQYETIYVTGTSLGYFPFKQFEIAKGSLFVEDDILNGNRVIVLSAKLAERLFGDADPIGKTVPIEAFGGMEQVEFTVIGVLAPPDEEQELQMFESDLYTGYAPFTAMPYVNRSGPDQEVVLDGFVIGVDVGVDLAWASEIIQAEIKQRYGDLAVIDSYHHDMQSLGGANYGIYIIIALFASIGLVIAVINILNLMLARVLRRVKSIGLSIALGSSKQGVFSQFLLEAVVLGFLGAGLGIGLSFGLMKLLTRLIYLEFTLGAASIAAAFGLGLLVSLLFGVYPAYQAAQTNPVDALRND